MFISFMFVASLQGYCQLKQNLHAALVKRYGTAFAWGNGYIVKANDFFGFCDKAGRFVIPIDKPSYDTLLPDRAAFYTLYGQVELVDASGKTLHRAAGVKYKLVNRSRRLLAQEMPHIKMLSLCDDKGKDLAQFDEARLKWGVSSFWIQKNGIYFDGAITINGDTILPPVYQRVVPGPGIAAGLRNDTIYIVDHKGTPVSQFAKVHSCEILANNLIVLEKHGAKALAKPNGQLLTPFRYHKINLLEYSYATVKEKFDRLGQAVKPDLCHHLIQVDGDYLNDGGGLLDTTGTIVLENNYENIDMNRNGWFILQKHHGAPELVDNNFKTVLRGPPHLKDYESIQFTDERYVEVPPDLYPNEKPPKVYDMELRGFVNPPDRKNANIERTATDNTEYERLRKRFDLVGVKKDTILINVAGSLAFRHNSKWGILSFTGDTILPFIYDTATGGNQQYPTLLGKEGRFGYVNWEGRLVTPVIFTDPYWIIESDSIVVSDNKTLYSYKGGTLRKIDPEKEQVNGFFNGYKKGIFCADAGGYRKPGLYNRNQKIITPPDIKPASCSDVDENGYIQIYDTARKHFALIDSSGRFLIPWTTNNNPRQFYNGYALMINNTGDIPFVKDKSDVLFRFEKNETIIESVTLDTASVTTHETKRWLKTYQGRPWIFKKKKYGMGIGGMEKLVLIKDAEEIKLMPELPPLSPDFQNYEDLQVRAAMVKIKGKWGLIDTKAQEIVPAEYDSISEAHYSRGNPRRHFFLYKKRKEGFVDLDNHQFISAAYDTIYTTKSLFNKFYVAGNKNGEVVILSENGKKISGGWDRSKEPYQNSLCSFPVTRNGKRFTLYPTLGDTLVTIASHPHDDSTQFVKLLYPDAAITKRKARYGVYDVVLNSVRIPHIYTRVEAVDDHLAAYDTIKESVAVYKWSGELLFTLKGKFKQVHQTGFFQWFLNGKHRGPIVNSLGKLIVPDSVYGIESVDLPGYPVYKGITEDNKTVIYDTSGKKLDPKFDEQLRYEQVIHDYNVVTRHRKKALIGPGRYGKNLTGFIYDEITPCHPGKSSQVDGSLQVSERYLENSDRFDPYFMVTKGWPEKYGLIDGYGNVMIPCIYDSLCKLLPDNNSVIVKKGKNWGVVSMDNTVLVPFKYRSISVSVPVKSDRDW